MKYVNNNGLEAQMPFEHRYINMVTEEVEQLHVGIDNWSLLGLYL